MKLFNLPLSLASIFWSLPILLVFEHKWISMSLESGQPACIQSKHFLPVKYKSKQVNNDLDSSVRIKSKAYLKATRPGIECYRPTQIFREMGMVCLPFPPIDGAQPRGRRRSDGYMLRPHVGIDCLYIKIKSLSYMTCTFSSLHLTSFLPP